MAAFAFIQNLDGTPVTLTSDQQRAVEAALQARAPGPVETRNWASAWGAFSGTLGSLVESGSTTLFCDGEPETPDGDGPAALLNLLSQASPLFPSLEEAEGHEPGERFLDSVTGSFAACFFDPSSGEVFLLRDRVGTRPVFWAIEAGRLFIASECKILQALGLELTLDPSGLNDAIRYRWVLEESCIFSPVSRVAPGSSVFFRGDHPPRARRYWRFRTPREPNTDGAMEAFQDEVDAGLRHVITKATQGGKRVGLLLSGGIDSSLLAAICAQELEDAVAYCGFIPGHENPEWERAKFVADHVGMEFRSVELDPNRFLEDFQYIGQRLQELPRHVNTLALMPIFRRAQKEVDVLMQGDAADTLFGLRIRRRLRHYDKRKQQFDVLPKILNRALIGLLEWTDIRRFVPLARILAFSPADYIRAGAILNYRKPARKIFGMTLLDTEPYFHGDRPEDGPIDELKRIHLLSTGVDGSLIRHDQLTRPLGIDSFAPFLTSTMVEIASRLPLELSFSEVSKPVLRGLLDRYLPPEVSRWKKVGFEVPEKEWLFGPLNPLFQEAAKAIPPTGVLPAKYFKGVTKTEDQEGMTTVIYLYILMKEFGLL